MEVGPLNVSPEVMEGELFSVAAAGGEAPPPLQPFKSPFSSKTNNTEQIYNSVTDD